MPFKKLGSGKYEGPSGRQFNTAQVQRYYARGGHFEKGGSVMRGTPMTKGSPPKNASFAKGGPVTGRTVDFMKIKDEFRDPDEINPNADEDQKYGKSGEGKGSGVVKAPPVAKKSAKDKVDC